MVSFNPASNVGPSLKAFETAATHGSTVQADGKTVVPAKTSFFGRLVNRIFGESAQQVRANQETRGAFHNALAGKFGEAIANKVLGNGAASTKSLSSREVMNASAQAKQLQHQATLAKQLPQAMGTLESAQREWKIASAKLTRGIQLVAQQSGKPEGQVLMELRGGNTKGVLSDKQMQVLSKLSDQKNELASIRDTAMNNVNTLNGGGKLSQASLNHTDTQLKSAMGAGSPAPSKAAQSSGASHAAPTSGGGIASSAQPGRMTKAEMYAKMRANSKAQEAAGRTEGQSLMRTQGQSHFDRVRAAQQAQLDSLREVATDEDDMDLPVDDQVDSTPQQLHEQISDTLGRPLGPKITKDDLRAAFGDDD